MVDQEPIITTIKRSDPDCFEVSFIRGNQVLLTKFSWNRRLSALGNTWNKDTKKAEEELGTNPENLEIGGEVTIVHSNFPVTRTV